MYRQDPQLQGYGTVPLICGVLIMILSAGIFLNGLRVKSDISGLSAKEKAAKTVQHLFSRDVMVMLFMIIAYCVLLAVNVPFIIASPVFLWGSMTYLSRGGWIKNIIYTVIIMVFVILVFNVGFNVVLP